MGSDFLFSSRILRCSFRANQHQSQDDLVKQVEFFKSIGDGIKAQRIKERVEYDMLPADGRKREFISIRIASKGYTVYKMSPMTATRIMTARDVNKEPDKSEACIAAMAHSVALAIVGSRNVFAGIRIWFLRRRIMRRASLPELFDAYNKTLAMLPIEDISQITAIMLGLAETIAKEP